MSNSKPTTPFDPGYGSQLAPSKPTTAKRLVLSQPPSNVHANISPEVPGKQTGCKRPASRRFKSTTQGRLVMRRIWIVALAAYVALKVDAKDVGESLDSSADVARLKTIPELDVQRYAGIWFEIAKFPNWFQRKCASGTKAEYRTNADGSVRVTNSCRARNGEGTEVVGEALQVGSEFSAKFKVRFAPKWLSFIPFVWGDYWVIELNNDYTVAAVSEPTRKYLWILSRSPRIDRLGYESLLGRLAAKGFDIEALELTKQD